MDFFVENWYVIIALLAVLAVAVVLAVKFFKKPTAEQLATVKEWLLYATTLAEKELGGGTGKLKLRYVYDMFASKFPWVAKVLSFDSFSLMVDESLSSMNDLLSKNAAVQLFVNGPAEPDDGDEAEG